MFGFSSFWKIHCVRGCFLTAWPICLFESRSPIVWSSFMRDYCRKLKLHWKHNFSPLTCWPTFSQFGLGIVFGGFSELLWENTQEILWFKMCSHTSSYSNESIRSRNTAYTLLWKNYQHTFTHGVHLDVIPMKSFPRNPRLRCPWFTVAAGMVQTLY